jgi:xanthine dehydrogenase YagT iron-sulfur-binding subunit
VGSYIRFYERPKELGQTPMEAKMDQAFQEPDFNSPSRRRFLQGAMIGSVGLGVGSLMLAEGTIEAAEPVAEQPKTASDAALQEVTLLINGEKHKLRIEPRVTLLDALREYIGLTGTKKGCDHGQCGACTVLIDDRRVNSCLTLAMAAEGLKITTIEGLANGEELHPVQAAFIKHDAFQCGYCTPGQICSAVGLINEKSAKTEDEIRELMSGNICRCGAYPNIVAAVKEVAGI